MEQLEALMKLGLSEAEALQVLEDDKKIARQRETLRDRRSDGCGAAGPERGKASFRKGAFIPLQFGLDYVFPLFHVSCPFKYRLISSFSCLLAFASVLADPFSLIPSILPISWCE